MSAVQTAMTNIGSSSNTDEGARAREGDDGRQGLETRHFSSHPYVFSYCIPTIPISRLYY